MTNVCNCTVDMTVKAININTSNICWCRLIKQIWLLVLHITIQTHLEGLMLIEAGLHICLQAIMKLELNHHIQ